VVGVRDRPVIKDYQGCAHATRMPILLWIAVLLYMTVLLCGEQGSGIIHSLFTDVHSNV
jgi:hypothetical protein